MISDHDAGIFETQEKRHNRTRVMEIVAMAAGARGSRNGAGSATDTIPTLENYSLIHPGSGERP
jgi:hypothetical protein